MAVTNSASATSAWRLSPVGATARVSSEAQTTMDRMPTPEIGLFDAPINPAMYPHTPAMTKPMISTKGTAIIVSEKALAARIVDFAKVKESHAEMTRQIAVSTMIQVGERSRSSSSVVATARDAASVLTSPPTTGFVSRTRV